LNGELAFIREAQAPPGAIEELNAKAATPSSRAAADELPSLTIAVKSGIVRSIFAKMAKEIENVSYLKIEVPQAAVKVRELIEPEGAAVVGPWDGDEAITLTADLDAGATGVMTGAGYPDGIRKIIDAYSAGNTELAAEHYQKALPLSTSWAIY
jgi:dihydrodipicolinate synthase/N-acetylneuraminate lyase